MKQTISFRPVLAKAAVGASTPQEVRARISTAVLRRAEMRQPILDEASTSDIMLDIKMSLFAAYATPTALEKVLADSMLISNDNGALECHA